MGYPLDDIAIYFDGAIINGAIIRDQKRDSPYRVQANHVCDLYHTYLNGYKPPITGRICLHLVPDKMSVHKPYYTGCILSCYAIIDEGDFVSKNSKER
jgi:hypothetical protein